MLHQWRWKYKKLWNLKKSCYNAAISLTHKLERKYIFTFKFDTVIDIKINLELTLWACYCSDTYTAKSNATWESKIFLGCFSTVNDTLLWRWRIPTHTPFSIWPGCVLSGDLIFKWLHQSRLKVQKNPMLRLLHLTNYVEKRFSICLMVIINVIITLLWLGCLLYI